MSNTQNFCVKPGLFCIDFYFGYDNLLDIIPPRQISIWAGN